MYSDRDGIASENSAAVYQARIRRLPFLTSLLAGIGFGASVVNGEYGNWVLSKNRFSSLRWSALCWPIVTWDTGLRGNLHGWL
ncbi:hypothetical protein ABOM_004176 [Aspergillus bombycis]|uniref:Uncharacterized protein n=1 Tax=Aspergillus bombycis TaxID=109264 RepID=A0A1F8A760_9EURO|nr:hypothetical protein ABOM_004176 [Aspergillus bombycis]OGM47564.1 hypothetical protein ABOM_004176 [Aspergillus bombycis]